MITTGQQIGAYTLLQQIGQGAMGAVFLAQHRRIARRAAFKVLIREISAKEAIVDRFFEEARNASQIRHPGIVEIFDCDIHEGQAYVVMELLDGESLARYLGRVGSLAVDLPFLLGLMTAIAEAVAAAHDVDVLHRALKPENVFLHLPASDRAAPAVSVKVVDFGIAQLSGADGGPSMTSTGVLLGSPAYMSPEQSRGGRLDRRSDVYSLGCVFYRALCGSPPFKPSGLADLILAHRGETPTRPGDLLPQIPAMLDSLIVQMLAKPPDQRPQSMREVVQSLRVVAQVIGADLALPLRPTSPVLRQIDDVAEGASGGSKEAPPSSREASREAAKPARGGPAKTLMLGAPDEAPGVPSVQAKPRDVSTGRPSPKRKDDGSPIQAFPGGTVALPNPSSSSPPPSSSSAELAGLAGGTMVLGQGRRPDLGSEVVPRVSSRRPPWRAIFAEKTPRKALLFGGGAVALVGLVVALAVGRSSKTPPASPPVPPPIASPAPPAPREPSPTVRIDLDGLPAGTDVSVDGEPAALILRIPRDNLKHRLVLREADGSVRSVSIDSARDHRIIDLAQTAVAPIAAPAAPKPRPSPAPRPEAVGSPPPTPSHPSAPRPQVDRRSPAPTAPGVGPPKRPAVSKDREAITDL